MRHPATELIEYTLFRLLAASVRRLPFRAASVVGGTLGVFTYRVLGIRRKITLENLSYAFPALAARERSSIARKAYRNYGTALTQMLWSWGAHPDALRRTVRLANPGVVLQAIAAEKGIILLSGHFGAWEFLISGLRLHLGIPFTVIVQHQRNRRIDALIDVHRRRFGNITVPMGPAVREVLQALRHGGAVAMLGDQSGPKEAGFVRFFGRPAATHRGAAAFSLKTGCPIVMVFLIRQPDESYEAVFEEVDRSGLPEARDEAVAVLTQRHTAVLERYITRYPDHWLWMHKRWKHTAFYESTHQPGPVGAAGASGCISAEAGGERH